MSRDYFRNRIEVGALKQFPVGALLAQVKNLTFDSSTDLTDNFTQNRGTNANQNVTGGVVQFRNGSYDQANNIETKFTMVSFSSLFINLACGATSSATNYHYPRVLGCKVLNSSNAVVTNFNIYVCFAYTYGDAGWNTWNNGYAYWRLDTDANDSTTAQAHRLGGAPSRGMVNHSYELLDIGGGYAQLKIDGTQVGSNMYLGNATYKLGGAVSMSPIDGWYNNVITADLADFIITYKLT